MLDDARRLYDRNGESRQCKVLEIRHQLESRDSKRHSAGIQGGVLHEMLE